VTQHEAVACYRLYAANCVEIAEHLDDTERRIFMLRMAQAWTTLADKVEAVTGSDDLTRQKIARQRS
jgi:hypothetical protein